MRCAFDELCQHLIFEISMISRPQLALGASVWHIGVPGFVSYNITSTFFMIVISTTEEIVFCQSQRRCRCWLQDWEIPQRGPTIGSFCTCCRSKYLRNSLLGMKLKAAGAYDAHERSRNILGRFLPHVGSPAWVMRSSCNSISDEVPRVYEVVCFLLFALWW